MIIYTKFKFIQWNNNTVLWLYRIGCVLHFYMTRIQYAWYCLKSDLDFDALHLNSIVQIPKQILVHSDSINLVNYITLINLFTRTLV